MPAKPYISFVLYTRNDNYGGRLIFKLKRSLNFLIAQLTDHGLDAEIIIVEWNPPKEEPLLQYTLRLEHSERVDVRYIVVPARFHRRFRSWNQFPGAANLAVNVGIRRACGQFILMRMSDVFYAESLVAFLARRELRSDRVYRTDRVDVAAEALNAPAEDRTAFLAHCASVAVREHHVLDSPQFPGGLSLHTNASGDFLLASKKSWNLVRGLPERGTVVSLDGDGLALYALVASGLEEEILPQSHCLFKVQHEVVSALRTNEELTPLVGEMETTLIEELSKEFVRFGLNIQNFGDVVRFWVRLVFDEPQRTVHGVRVSYPSYTEFLYRAWLLAERCPRPLLAKVRRSNRLLRGGTRPDLVELRGRCRHLLHLIWEVWEAYRIPDPHLFSYRYLARRICCLTLLGLARRPYVLNRNSWGLGRVRDLPDTEAGQFVDRL